MLKLDFFRVSTNDIVAQPVGPRQVLEEDQLRFIHEYWLRLGGDGGLPSMNSIDPVDMIRYLGGLALADVADGGRDFRLRLLGTRLDEHFEACYTGWRVSQMPDQPARNALFSSLIPAARERRPYFAKGLLATGDEDETRFKLVALPLAREDGSVGRVLMSWQFEIRRLPSLRRRADAIYA